MKQIIKRALILYKDGQKKGTDLKISDCLQSSRELASNKKMAKALLKTHQEMIEVQSESARRLLKNWTNNQTEKNVLKQYLYARSFFKKETSFLNWVVND